MGAARVAVAVAPASARLPGSGVRSAAGPVSSGRTGRPRRTGRSRTADARGAMGLGGRRGGRRGRRRGMGLTPGQREAVLALAGGQVPRCGLATKLRLVEAGLARWEDPPGALVGAQGRREWSVVLTEAGCEVARDLERRWAYTHGDALLCPACAGDGRRVAPDAAGWRPVPPFVGPERRCTACGGWRAAFLRSVHGLPAVVLTALEDSFLPDEALRAAAVLELERLGLRAEPDEIHVGVWRGL